MEQQNKTKSDFMKENNYDLIERLRVSNSNVNVV